ncbi:hypothetical protein [Streptomyces specialis]|uniref:hypothetical protein n=1 Tax=Streptomyces specialis TaxID=498367 RepID=UPI000A7D32F6|nr:hypothetical protein [Streptomyces specialis]
MTDYPPGDAGHEGAPWAEPGRRHWSQSSETRAVQAGARHFTARLFTASPAELSSARHYTAETLERWELSATIDDARSVISELMAWAMSDTSPDSVWLGLAHHNALLCVLIPRFVDPSRARRPAAASRYRRHIINALTREWGRTHAAEGTALWARIPVAPQQP